MAGKTLSQRAGDIAVRGMPDCPQHFLGELVNVNGEKGETRGSVRATLVHSVPTPDVPVSGYGLIDAVIRKSDDAVSVRGDGYILQVSKNTHVIYEPSLTPSLTSFNTNQWVAYKGVLHADGTVVVQTATLSPNVITDVEVKLRRKQEFNPASNTEENRQSVAGRVFFGVNRTRIPVANNPVLQARIDAIGKSLIPRYQRELPEGDPSRIDFRFQVVHETKYPSIYLASGIILLSEEAMSRLTTDAELATVLAVNIAGVLQKQELRAMPALHTVVEANAAIAVAGLLFPGAGILTAFALSDVGSADVSAASEQTSREALCLMHDAGYDLRRAPATFWILNERPGKPLEASRPPERSRYLFQLLGTVWRGALMQGTPAAT